MKNFIKFIQKNNFLLFLFLFGLALFLRLYGIQHQNIWFDEAYSWNETIKPTSQIIISAATSDVHPPLYYIVLKYWIFFSGDSVFAMRFLSVLFNIATMLFVFLIMRQLKKESALLIVCLLMAISPYEIYFSQEMRMYSMLAMFFSASVFFYIKLLEKGWELNCFLIGFILSIVLGLYTHLIAILITGGIFFHFVYSMTKGSGENFVKKKLILRFCLTFGIIAVFFLPWVIVLWFYQAQTLGGQDWRAKVSVFNAFYELGHFLISPFLGMHYGNKIPIYVANSILIAILILISWKTLIKEKMISAIVFIPQILACMVLIISRRQYDLARYLFPLSPLIMIFFSLVISSQQKYFKYFLIGLVTVFSFVSLSEYYSTASRDSNHTKVIETISRLAQPGDRIFISPSSIHHIYGYYLRNDSIKNSVKYLSDNNSSILLDYQSSINIWVALDYRSEFYKQLPESIFSNRDSSRKAVDYDFSKELTRLINWKKRDISEKNQRAN